MALDTATYITNLNAAFLKTTWAECAADIASATDLFILGGAVTISIIATVTPPSGSPYPQPGTGTGTIATPGPSGMVSAITTAFLSQTWATVGSDIATVIDSHVRSAVVTSVYSSTLVGGGSGAITPTGLSAMSSSLVTAFTTAISWLSVATDISNAVSLFLTTATVSTTDSGAVPPTAWAGVGSGIIS